MVKLNNNKNNFFLNYYRTLLKWNIQMLYRNYPILLIFLTLALITAIQCQPKQPKLMLRRSEVQDVKKAQLYLQRQLQMFDHRSVDNYTLYLAVKNYANKLEKLELTALSKLKKQIFDHTGKPIENLYIGSGNHKQNNGKFSVAKKTSLDEDKSLMYFKKWKINLNNILQLQVRPQNVITKVTSNQGQGNLKGNSNKNKW